jgi:hypothetical protein
MRVGQLIQGPRPAAGDHHPPAVLSQGDCGGSADTAAAPGYHCDSICHRPSELQPLGNDVMWSCKSEL